LWHNYIEAVQVTTTNLSRSGVARLRPGLAGQAHRTVFTDLPATYLAPRLARQATRAALALWELTSLQEAAEAIVSELVANALLHGSSVCGAGIGLLLETDWIRLRIEVHDTDPCPPKPCIPAALAESGFGFVIVQALADKWGTSQTADGKAVWAELATEPVRADARCARSVADTA
jgi:anti-sigma regulatory factor (Ser/Thr protein kinase)